MKPYVWKTVVVLGVLGIQTVCLGGQMSVAVRVPMVTIAGHGDSGVVLGLVGRW